MNRINKFLLKLSRKDRERLGPVVEAIVLDTTGHLDVRKLKGKDSEYRVRIGKIRVQFIHTESGNIITDISFRNDNTY